MFRHNIYVLFSMVFDIEIEHDGILYECGVMERFSGDSRFFAIDIRIPGTGASLSTQLHSLELYPDPHTGTYTFHNAPADTPKQIFTLAAKLDEAIRNTTSLQGK